MIGSTLSELERSGGLVITGGSLKTLPHAHLFVYCKVHDRHRVVVKVRIEDIGATRPDGHSRYELEFEMPSFSTEVLYRQKIDYAELVNGCVVYEKADDLISNVTNSVVWNYCKKIRLNITPNIVTCFMRMNTDLNLKSVNAFEWQHDDVLRHFFEGRRGPLI